jgi:hypothetical protein
MISRQYTSGGASVSLISKVRSANMLVTVYDVAGFHIPRVVTGE